MDDRSPGDEVLPLHEPGRAFRLPGLPGLLLFRLQTRRGDRIDREVLPWQRGRSSRTGRGRDYSGAARRRNSSEEVLSSGEAIVGKKQKSRPTGGYERRSIMISTEFSRPTMAGRGSGRAALPVVAALLGLLYWLAASL